MSERYPQAENQHDSGQKIDELLQKKPTKQLNQKKTYKHVKTDTNNAPLECSSSTEIFVYWRIRLM